jgi:hypothetical protein
MQHGYKTFRHVFFAMLAATMFNLLLAPRVCAQQSGIDRPYQPVVLKGSNFPEFSSNRARLDSLFLYKYTSASKLWEQIPFQFDEVEPDSLDAARTTYFRRGDGKLDNLDELAFMARDAGDKAPADSWIANVSSSTFPRYEIRLNDPLSIGSAGYVYLFRSATLSINPGLKDYIKYSKGPANNAGADTVRGESFRQGHAANGLPNFLQVLPPGGNETNFMDRLKIRAKASILTLNEANNFTILGAPKFRDGRVRVVKEVQNVVGVPLIDLRIDTLAITISYFPFSQALATELRLSAAVSATLLRLSFDFNANASGAQWFNENNGPLLVNRTSEPAETTQFNKGVVTSPAVNWFLLSSGAGSVVGLFEIGAIANSSLSFYYHDAPSGTNDGTSDTGDNQSYGDSGLLITSGSAIVDTVNLGITTYYLGKNQPREIGATLRDQTRTPLALNVQRQNFSTGVREAAGPAPQRFALLQNSPNPVSPATSTTIRYELPFSGNAPVSLRIYNLLGQSVRELVNAAQPAGKYEVRWDGRLENGELAPAGIYFYQLRAGQQTVTRKLMLLNR